jgi:hypothetical protein
VIVLDPAKKDALGGAATFKQVLFTVAALQAPSCRPADTPHFRAREEAIITGYLRSAGAYDVSARYVQVLQNCADSQLAKVVERLRRRCPMRGGSARFWIILPKLESDKALSDSMWALSTPTNVLSFPPQGPFSKVPQQTARIAQSAFAPGSGRRKCAIYYIQSRGLEVFAAARQIRGVGEGSWTFQASYGARGDDLINTVHQYAQAMIEASCVQLVSVRE